MGRTHGWEKDGILRKAHELAVARLIKYGFMPEDDDFQYESLFFSELKKLKKAETRKLANRKTEVL